MLRLRQLSPITRRVLFGFLLSSTVFFLSTTLVRMAFDYQAALAQSRHGLEVFSDVILPPTARALWNYDLKQLDAEVKAANVLPSVVKIEILDDHNQVVVSSNKQGELLPIDEVVTRSIPGVDRAEAIGTIKFYVSYTPAKKGFLRRLQQEVVMDFFGISLLASLFFYLLHRNIIANLIDVVRGVKQLELHDEGSALVLARKPHQRDEFDQLVDAINVFHREILDERAGRKQMELQSRSLGNELARMGRVATVQSLTTTIAHELNQPLAAILSNAETIELSMLDKFSPDDPLREILTDIASEARRAGQIIRNLRSLMERREVETAPLDLKTLVQRLADLMRLDTRWESIRVDLQLPEALPSVMGSAVQLQQVILNLVANARDAILQAGVADGVIVISIRQQDKRWLRISVMDNGPGVELDKIDYILKPFVTTKSGGTGMGLWIAQMIIEQHGGKLEISNELGGGACFSFLLPIQVSA